MSKGIRAINQPCPDCKGQATLDESNKEHPIYICDKCEKSWDAPDNKESKNKAFKLTSTCPNCNGIAFTYMANIAMWNCKTCDKQWVKEESDYGDVKEEHGFLIPTGYIFSKESGIQKITIKKSKKADADDEEIIEDVCYAPIIITKTLQNCDTNEVSVEVSFPDSKNREIKYVIPQGELLQKNGIMKLAGYGLSVTDKKASILAEYINKFMHVNKNKIKEERLYSTLGWKNDYTSFVLGTEEIFKDKVEPIIITNAPTSITNAISRGGTIEGWIASTRSLLKHDRARFKCYISCSAPILSIIDQQSGIMNDYGDSSSGKTTTNECGMSIWGNSDLLNLTALATKVGVEELVRLFCNIPVNLDDVQTTDPVLFKEVVYMVGNESGKLRGKKTGGLKDVARWKTKVFMTGETPINDDKSLTGQKVRAIDIKGGLGASDILAVNEFEDGKKLHYGHIAPILIKKILNKKEEIPLLYNKVLKELVVSGNDNNVASRLRKVFATFVVSGMLFEEIMGELGEVKKDPQEICKNVMTDAMKEISEETYALRAIKCIYSWIDETNKHFIGSVMVNQDIGEKAPTDIYGKFDGALTLDIYTRPLKKELKGVGFDYKRVIDDFEELKWINKANDHIRVGKSDGRGITLDVDKIYKDTKMNSPYLRPDRVIDVNKDFEPIKNGDILKMKVTNLSTFATDV